MTTTSMQENPDEKFQVPKGPDEPWEESGGQELMNPLFW